MTKLTPLSAGFATVGQGAGPMMVTWRAGLFEKHGLDLPRPRIMGGAKGVVRGLMSGEIQFGNLAAPAPLRANLKGEADVVFLTGGINQQFIIGRPGIQTREQLAGKKSALSATPGSTTPWLNLSLKNLTPRELPACAKNPLRRAGKRRWTRC